MNSEKIQLSLHSWERVELRSEERSTELISDGGFNQVAQGNMDSLSLCLRYRIDARNRSYFGRVSLPCGNHAGESLTLLKLNRQAL